MRSEQLPSTPTQLDRISLVEQTISDDWANSSRVSIETSGNVEAMKATESLTNSACLSLVVYLLNDTDLNFPPESKAEVDSV